MEEPVYTEGVCADGAAILKDGVMITITQVLDTLNEGHAAEAEIARLRTELRNIEARAFSIYLMTDSHEVEHEALVVRDAARAARRPTPPVAGSGAEG